MSVLARRRTYPYRAELSLRPCVELRVADSTVYLGSNDIYPIRGMHVEVFAVDRWLAALAISTAIAGLAGTALWLQAHFDRMCWIGCQGMITTYAPCAVLVMTTMATMYILFALLGPRRRTLWLIGVAMDGQAFRSTVTLPTRHGALRAAMSIRSGQTQD